MGVIEETEEFVKQKMKSLPPSHDFLHVDRVRKLAVDIGKQMGADLEILELAALLHDVGLPDELERRGDHAEISARIAEEFLRGKIPDDKLEGVIDAIENHRYSRGKTPRYLEGRILQDADRLDAIGAIGIARVFASAKANTRFFYNPNDPFWETNRELDDKTFALDHFYRKLLKLESTMNTDIAKREARKRTRFMKIFLDEMRQEI